MEIGFEAAFWARVEKRSDDGCWLWTANLSRKGYGRVWRDGKVRFAHRVSYDLAHGPIPDGMLVCHHCDNPRCVRPDHLFVGSAADNAADCIAKGRFRYCHPPCRTHCQRGHEFTDQNTIRDSSGKRKCRSCWNAKARARRRLRNQQNIPRGCASFPCAHPEDEVSALGG